MRRYDQICSYGHFRLTFILSTTGTTVPISKVIRHCMFLCWMKKESYYDDDDDDNDDDDDD